MATPRTGQTATLLADGRVLMVGAADHPVLAELYDPQKGTFATTGSPIYLSSPTATLLDDGEVLIVGGWAYSDVLYDPKTGSFGATGRTVAARGQHAAVLLSDGRVLIVGGIGDAEGITSAELYS